MDTNNLKKDFEIDSEPNMLFFIDHKIKSIGFNGANSFKCFSTLIISAFFNVFFLIF